MVNATRARPHDIGEILELLQVGFSRIPSYSLDGPANNGAIRARALRDANSRTMVADMGRSRHPSRTGQVDAARHRKPILTQLSFFTIASEKIPNS